MIIREIERRLRAAVASVCPEEDVDEIVARPCGNAKFGDYQSHSLMAIAKRRNQNPRELAERVAASLAEDALWDKVEVAGPGFLNFHLSREGLADELSRAHDTDYVFLDIPKSPKTVVIDFSSPNVAKPMHVGHIRSTILGDTLARVFRALGNRVITDNHIGDWGTQFGKLLVGWKRDLNEEALESDPLGEMERIYKTVNAECETTPATLELARRELVALQRGAAENLKIWNRMLELSKRQFDEVYDRLGIQFDHTLGESAYNDQLSAIVSAYLEAGIAREDQGAALVFFDDNPRLKDKPLMIRKSDGASNYATTDLATLEYRIQNWKPDEIIYVTDARQQLHFEQVIEAFRRMRPGESVKLSHVWFGAILGPDGRPFKTRSGETIRLKALLDEAEERGFAAVNEKNPELPEEMRREIGRKVGLGAVKFSDLAPNRQTDYRFDWDKCLAFDGATAPYLMYVYTRVAGIRRKLEANDEIQVQRPDFSALEDSAEIALAKKLIHFGFVVETVADEYRPNYLCAYLVELAADFSRFYQSCPALKSEEPVRSMRLGLCELTAKVMRSGLDLLGIETSEVM